MHRFGKGKNVASVLKYHGEMWCDFAVPHFAVPNFAPAKISAPPAFAMSMTNELQTAVHYSTFAVKNVAPSSGHVCHCSYDLVNGMSYVNNA